jgi:hypothetical protein
MLYSAHRLEYWAPTGTRLTTFYPGESRVAEHESTTKAVVIAGITILRDTSGRYSLNTLHQASGASETKRPGQWLKRKSTQELIDQLDSQVLFSTLDVIHGGEHAGTYAHELLAVSYAGWISPSFQLQVNRVFLETVHEPGPAPAPAPALPELHDPAYQLLVKTVCDLDATRHQLALLEARERERDKALIATQQKMIEGFLLAEQADTKATLALEDARRMSLEDFVLSNGLLRQFPVTQWPHIATWLRRFCQQWGLEVIKTAVPGKLWKDENTYPLSAIGAWYRQELHRPRQITLLKEAPDGAPTD